MLFKCARQTPEEILKWVFSSLEVLCQHESCEGQVKKREGGTELSSRTQTLIMNRHLRTVLPCVLRFQAINDFIISRTFSPCSLTCHGLLRSHTTSVKTRSYLQYLKRKIKAPPSPPYSHVCQVGDSVLRGKAAAVEPSAIGGAEVQQVIKTLVKVMRRLECVGLSAPQIGVPLQIIALEYPEKMLEDSPPALIKARGLASVPLKIFINPQLRVLDGQTITFQEGCESISGFSASVPRYVSVQVSGLNEKAEPVTWQATGWPARILQHEMDHLGGVLYIDRMDSKTFINVNWEQYNE